jgi:hypothetical protein
MPTWEDVVRIGRSLAEVEESTSYGQPALKVAGKSFANMSSRAPGALHVRVDPEERPFLIASNPAAFFVTPHYEAWPGMLVRLEVVDCETLRAVLEDAWALRAPARLLPPA